MSTEEKAIKNPEKTETPKPKRRFKLDKKHIQGFIAGILLCAIAFTGLHYGTDGRFFKGEMDANLTFVTEATFENEVIKSEIPVLVLYYSQESRKNPYFNRYNPVYKRDYCDVAMWSAGAFDGIVKFVFANVDEAPGLVDQLMPFSGPTYKIFRDGQIVSEKTGPMTEKQLYDWVELIGGR